MLAAQKAEDGPLLISSPSDIQGSIVNDTVVQRNCTLHVRGNLLGSLTIEQGASVIVEGSVDGKILNKGGRLVVNNKGIAAYVCREGPDETEACGILKIDLTSLAANWDALVKRCDAECAAVVKGNAYGCGLEPVAGGLARSGCKTFFVSNIPEARRARAVAPNATIYVLNGFYPGSGPAFADINACPVINSSIEMAEWDVFVTSQPWGGGCALNVDTGETRLGLSMEEATAFSSRVQTLNHGINLVISRLDHPEKPNHPLTERQIGRFRDLRRLYDGVPMSLANSSGIFVGSKTHFDLVRVGSALYGVNPTPGQPNPMLSVIELKARIAQVRTLAQGESIADCFGWTARRRTRVALVSAGYADGYPCTAYAGETKLGAIVGGRRCPVVGRPSMDLLPIDVTDLPDPTAARYGEMVTLIGAEVGIDELAAASKSTGREVLTGGLGNRFHRIYYAI
ncbi:MAG TPA: alanine racemase [Xanthobacteraceae bacterium]|jgi:alanine racemase|nr:alanine racemase [Xanthobacteraceae bacterium]